MMMNLLSVLLATSAGLVAILVFVFCIEILIALIAPKQQRFVPPRKRKRIAVIVPAHDEASGLLATLSDIKAQLHSGDRLVVVADNCTDNTASVAREAGAEVTERHDLDKIGKGYALDWGIRHLRFDSSEVVIIIDADCRLGEGVLDQLAAACAMTGRPAQALYLMTAPTRSLTDFRLAEFAFRVKNWVRPLGLLSLNLPCQLMGTGMAFPIETIRSADLASGEIVEDLRLGLDLTRNGNAPLFCPSAIVKSDFPVSIQGAKDQRRRWEQGHIGIIATIIPRLIYESLVRGNVQLLALAFDAAIPPVTLLGMLVSLIFMLSGLGLLISLSASGFLISAASLVAYSLAVLVCWWKFGRDILSFSSLLSTTSYGVAKLLLYNELLFYDKSPRWIRTDRRKASEDGE